MEQYLSLNQDGFHFILNLMLQACLKLGLPLDDVINVCEITEVLAVVIYLYLLS